MFLSYLGIVRNCFIHNKYCNFLFPNNFIGALCIKFIIFSIDLTLVTFNFEQLFLSTYIAVVKDKYLRIAHITVSPCV